MCEPLDAMPAFLDDVREGDVSWDIKLSFDILKSHDRLPGTLLSSGC